MPQGIGDVIMTIPVISELVKRDKSHISISVKSQTEALILGELCQDIDIDFIILNEIFENNSTLISFFKVIHRLRRLSPDIIFTQFNVSAVKSSLTSFFAGVKTRVGWSGPFSFLNTLTLEPSGLHKIAENLKSLAVLNYALNDIELVYPKFHGNPPNKTRPELSEILNSDSKKIAISPGSQDFDSHKRWPKLYFSELINKILSDDDSIQVYMIGDKNEITLCDDIIQAVDKKERISNLSGKTSIPELLYFLSRMQLTITNCNGTSHMACVADSPIIGIYGPTDYQITGPISDKFVPITAGLDCSPCYRRDYRFGCGDPVCMENIAVDKVYEAVKKFI
jgi:heptosyltransferase-2